jgi:hypothetical protein
MRKTLSHIQAKVRSNIDIGSLPVEFVAQTFRRRPEVEETRDGRVFQVMIF